MITSLTPDQASYIASVLSTLRYDGIANASDGFSISINLHDDRYADPVGKFTQEEGAWLFEFLELPRPKMPTLDEVAQIVYDENPLHYRDRKINHIKDVRQKWTDLTGSPSSLVDTKRSVENVIQDVALAELREKLTTSPYGDEYSDVDEDRAYAEHRERMAERGTWFGASGPMDEEPF